MSPVKKLLPDEAPLDILPIDEEGNDVPINSVFQTAQEKNEAIKDARAYFAEEEPYTRSSGVTKEIARKIKKTFTKDDINKIVKYINLHKKTARYRKKKGLHPLGNQHKGTISAGGDVLPTSNINKPKEISEENEPCTCYRRLRHCPNDAYCPHK